MSACLGSRKLQSRHGPREFSKLLSIRLCNSYFSRLDGKNYPLSLHHNMRGHSCSPSYDRILTKHVHICLQLPPVDVKAATPTRMITERAALSLEEALHPFFKVSHSRRSHQGRGECAPKRGTAAQQLLFKYGNGQRGEDIISSTTSHLKSPYRSGGRKAAIRPQRRRRRGAR